MRTGRFVTFVENDQIGAFDRKEAVIEEHEAQLRSHDEDLKKEKEIKKLSSINLITDYKITIDCANMYVL